MTKEQWAAWVQALGSLAAIVVALVLWRLDRKKSRGDAIALASAFCFGAAAALEKLKTACLAHDRTGTRSFIEVVNDTRLLGQGVSVDRLPMQHVKVVVTLRAILAHISVTVEHGLDQPVVSWDSLNRFVAHNQEQFLGVLAQQGLLEFASAAAKERFEKATGRKFA